MIFGADGFCLQSFYGTDAAFRLICFLFNLIADFKREVTQDDAPRLSTLRTKVLVIGGILGAEGRHTVLRLGLRDPWRHRFAALLERIIALAFPTVAQFTDYLKNSPPRPWKPRGPATLGLAALACGSPVRLLRGYPHASLGTRRDARTCKP
jgi:hypothetical protein